MQGAEVLGPVPAPFLAPAKPKHLPPAVAPVAAMPDTPLSFLIKGITNFAEQASAAANANSASGRKLQQQPARPQQPGPQQPAQPHVSCMQSLHCLSFCCTAIFWPTRHINPLIPLPSAIHAPIVTVASVALHTCTVPWHSCRRSPSSSSRRSRRPSRARSPSPRT